MEHGYCSVQLKNNTDVETEADTLRGKAGVTVCHSSLWAASVQAYSSSITMNCAPVVLRNIPVCMINYLVSMVTGLGRVPKLPSLLTQRCGAARACLHYRFLLRGPEGEDRLSPGLTTTLVSCLQSHIGCGLTRCSWGRVVLGTSGVLLPFQTLVVAGVGWLRLWVKLPISLPWVLLPLQPSSTHSTHPLALTRMSLSSATRELDTVKVRPHTPFIKTPQLTLYLLWALVSSKWQYKLEYP